MSIEFKEGQTVGIDLGTTFSAISVLDENGDPQTIPNEDENEETPSLLLLAEAGKVIVGPRRDRAALEHPDRVVERVKRFMGANDFKRVFDGREITPEFLSALILKKLKQDAEKRIGKIGNAVITVPYYFNDARRKATQDAGRIAGLNVVDIINEPTAATLTYAWNRRELGAGTDKRAKPHRALVYDLGGGTFDVTVVQYTPTHFQVLATDGDVQLGGVDWNDRIVNYVAEQFLEQHGIELRQFPQAVQQLRHEADVAKVALTADESTVIYFRFEGKAAHIKLTREKFEELTADLLQRTLDTTELVLEAAKLQPKDLDAIVLVGGSTLMPRVPVALEKALGIKPYQGLSPHLAVTQGAAIHAAILEAKFRGADSPLAERVRKRLQHVQQDDVNSHGLGIAVRDPRSKELVNHVMIPKNTKLPTEKRQTFRTNEANQTRVTVKIYEGDAPDPAACTYIGQCRITNLPTNLPKGAPVEVTYSFGTDGRVRVLARDLTGGREANVELDRQGGLSEQQVDSFTLLARDYSVI